MRVPGVVYLLPLIVVGSLIAFATLKSWLFDSRKVYTRAEFESVMRGKTESEVEAIIGPPQATGQETWNSPQADKRYTAHYADGSKWAIAGEDGAVVIFYSVDKRRADYFLYVPRPPSGRSITIRW